MFIYLVPWYKDSYKIQGYPGSQQVLLTGGNDPAVMS